ncbi:MAG: hypothetical protein K1X82_07780 [Bacteroidia bacterium]|nr:hypothetical protein [Bacteroidia bacterium]
MNAVRIFPLLISWLFLGQAYLSAQSLVSHSRWTNQNVVVDGIINEWEKPLGAYDYKTRIMFALLNDSSNLYICLVVPDEANQIKISRGGLKVSFNLKNKKEKLQKNIVYPIGSGGPMHQGEAPTLLNGKPNMKLFQTEFYLNNTLKRLEGFSSASGLLPLKDSSGVQVAIGWDSLNTMQYELAIPLKELLLSGNLTQDWIKELQMEITVFGLEKKDYKDKDMEDMMNTPNPMSGSRNQSVADMNNNPMANNPMAGTIGNGSPINMAPNTGSFNSRPEKGPMFEKQSFKYKFLLSGPKAGF